MTLSGLGPAVSDRRHQEDSGGVRGHLDPERIFAQFDRSMPKQNTCSEFWTHLTNGASERHRRTVSDLAFWRTANDVWANASLLLLGIGLMMAALAAVMDPLSQRC